jgi:UDP-glucose:(glucosyl)LPS alpha-1,2-glucosyltransferase
MALSVTADRAPSFEQAQKDLLTPVVDPYNGRYLDAKGGSELMYDRLMRRLPEELAGQFQIVVSRVRDLLPGKKAVLWCQDRWNDSESDHLRHSASRLRFRKIVFVSNYQFNSYNQGLGVRFAESVILRNAVEPICTTLPDKPKDRIRLIYHTTPHRGLEILVPVFASLAAERPELHLDVYSSFRLHGLEDRDARYQHLFRMCIEHPQITYHGAVSNEEIREAVKRAHIFAYPSIFQETSCIAAIEAMSAGCLVVCPDLAALPETVGECGVMYRWTEDVRSHADRFAAALRSGIKMLENGRGIGLLDSAQRRVNVLYNWNTRIDEWVRLLQSLAEKEDGVMELGTVEREPVSFRRTQMY